MENVSSDAGLKYTVSVTANNEDTEASLVLIGKDKENGAINAVKVESSFNLAKGVASTGTIDIAWNDVFYAYLWKKGTMHPIRKAITDADVTSTVTIPSGSCTKGDVIKLLWEASGSEAVEPVVLTDVPADSHSSLPLH